MKTGPGQYKAVGQGPQLPPDPDLTPGVIAAFAGVHGEFVKKGPEDGTVLLSSEPFEASYWRLRRYPE